MGEIVNLRTARKRIARRQDAARAAENRLIHGRTKAQRELELARAEKARRQIEGHQIETEDAQ